MLSGTTGGLGSFGELTLGYHGIGRDTVTSQLPDQKWTLTVDRPMRVGFSLTSSQTDVDLRLFHGKTPRVTSTTPGLAPESFAQTLRPGHYTLIVSKHAQADGYYELHVDTSVVASPTRVEAEALGGTAVRVNWLDHSDNESGFAVQQWRKHKWHTVVRADKDATAAVVHNQPINAAMTFRVRSEASGGTGISPDAAVVQTESVDTSGWFKVTDVGEVGVGEAKWTLQNDTLEVSPDYDDKWVFAASWPDAVYTAVQGEVDIKRTDGTLATHTFPYEGDFKVGYAGIMHDDFPDEDGKTGDPAGTSPPIQIDGNELPNNDDEKVITIEDSYGAIDRDYDDFYSTADTDYMPSVFITANAPYASEAPPLNTGEFTVTRTGDTTNALSVEYTVAGTATSGSDYPTLSGTVEIQAGEPSATIDITPTADSDDWETDESIELTVKDTSNYKAGVPITDPKKLIPEEVQATVVIRGKNGFTDQGATAQNIIWWVKTDTPAAGDGWGGKGNQGLGAIEREVPPQIETGTDSNGLAWARVKAATGEVVVRRGYTSVVPGDQGVGAAGSGFAGKRVYVTAQLSQDLDSHEQGHVTATGKVFANTIQTALDKAAQYRATPLQGAAGQTEAQVKAQLEALIDWNDHRQDFIDKDTQVNSSAGTFHAWETAQGGGPADTNPQPGAINGVNYDFIFKSRVETDPNYILPDYGTFDPWAQ